MDQAIKDSVNRLVEPDGFEAYTFKVGWYNDVVADPFKLQYHPDTLAIIVLSLPQMFEKTFLPFVYEEINRILGETVERKQNERCDLKHETEERERDDGTNSRTEHERPSSIPHSNTFQVLQDPMDQCMKHYFEKLKSMLLVENIENGIEGKEDIIVMHDFDMNHGKRRPLVLMQTAGHVAGAAFYYQMKNRTTKERRQNEERMRETIVERTNEQNQERKKEDEEERKMEGNQDGKTENEEERKMEENEGIEVTKVHIQQNQLKLKEREINNMEKKEEIYIYRKEDGKNNKKDDRNGENGRNEEKGRNGESEEIGESIIRNQELNQEEEDSKKGSICREREENERKGKKEDDRKGKKEDERKGKKEDDRKGKKEDEKVKNGRKESLKGWEEDSDLFHHHHHQVYGNEERNGSGDRFDGFLEDDNVMSCRMKRRIKVNEEERKEKEEGIESRNDVKMKRIGEIERAKVEKMRRMEKDEEIEEREKRRKVEEKALEGKTYLAGVSIHPRFGGWFAFRSVLVFPRIQVEGMVQVDPLDVVTSEEERDRLIASFTQDWKSGEYRSIIQPVTVYSDRQRRYFQTKPNHRIPLLMTFFRQNSTSREFVLGR